MIFLAAVVVSGCHAQPRPNLLLISLDTTRADYCSWPGSDRRDTPHLASLAARGVHFNTAYATTPSTGPSHATLFTGVLPFSHGVLTNGDRLGPEPRTLAEHLSAAGYRTAGIASSFVLDAGFGFDRGFDRWDDECTVGGSKTRRTTWEGHSVPAGFDRRADETTDVAVEWLREHGGSDRPFSLFVHYFEPHGPYDPPDQWRKKYPAPSPEDDLLAAVIAGYRASLAYTDAEVGRLMESLHELHLDTDTLVVVVGDHGEGLMDHGIMAHTEHLYEEAVRIPFILVWPGRLGVGLEVSTPVSLVDVTPTVLDLLGVAGGTLVDGRSLAPLLGGRAVAEEPVILVRGPLRPSSTHGRLGILVGVRDDHFKYLAGAGEPARLYDLDRDPGERHNLAGDRSRESARMEEIARLWLGRAVDGGPSELTADEAEGLRALGYQGP